MSRPPVLLVTGGMGLIGGHILRQAAGWQTHATWFHRPPVGLSPAVTWHQIDITDPAAVAVLVAAVRPCAIIHTAYQFNTPDMERAIIDGTRHVALAAAGVGARLVYLSTDVVFDGRRGQYRETDTPNPLHPYGRAKLQSERGVQAITPAAIIVRTSLVYDLDPPDARSQWVIDGGRGLTDVTLFTDERRCPIYAPDLAAALLELAANDFQGLLHVAGPEALSRYDFGALLCQAVGAPADGLKATVAASSGLTRPLDCTLDTSLAQRVLGTPLRSATEVARSRMGRGQV